MSQTLKHTDGGLSSDCEPTAEGTISTVSFAPVGDSSGFSPSGFTTLCEIIGNNITAVLSSSRYIEKKLKLIKTPQELLALSEVVCAINKKTNARIQTISQGLERLQAVVQKGDIQQKLQFENMTKECQGVVEEYSSHQKRIYTAMRQSLRQAQACEHDTEALAYEELLQQQRLEEVGLQQEHDLLVDRQRQVEQLQSDLIDLQVIMTNIMTLVHEQGETVDFIETIIEKTGTNVEVTRHQSYRMKILILLVIAVIIASVIIGIIVHKLKK